MSFSSSSGTRRVGKGRGTRPQASAAQNAQALAVFQTASHLERALYEKIRQNTARDSDRYRPLFRLLKGRVPVTSQQADSKLLYITRAQFQDVLAVLGLHATPSQARQLFDKYDINGDRRISIHEFIRRARGNDYGWENKDFMARELSRREETKSAGQSRNFGSGVSAKQFFRDGLQYDKQNYEAYIRNGGTLRPDSQEIPVHALVPNDNEHVYGTTDAQDEQSSKEALEYQQMLDRRRDDLLRTQKMSNKWIGLMLVPEEEKAAGARGPRENGRLGVRLFSQVFGKHGQAVRAEQPVPPPSVYGLSAGHLVDRIRAKIIERDRVTRVLNNPRLHRQTMTRLRLYWKGAGAASLRGTQGLSSKELFNGAPMSAGDCYIAKRRENRLYAYDRPGNASVSSDVQRGMTGAELKRFLESMNFPLSDGHVNVLVRAYPAGDGNLDVHRFAQALFPVKGGGSGSRQSRRQQTPPQRKPRKPVQQRALPVAASSKPEDVVRAIMSKPRVVNKPKASSKPKGAVSSRKPSPAVRVSIPGSSARGTPTTRGNDCDPPVYQRYMAACRKQYHDGRLFVPRERRPARLSLQDTLRASTNSQAERKQPKARAGSMSRITKKVFTEIFPRGANDNTFVPANSSRLLRDPAAQSNAAPPQRKVRVRDRRRQQQRRMAGSLGSPKVANHLVYKALKMKTGRSFAEIPEAVVEEKPYLAKPSDPSNKWVKLGLGGTKEVKRETHRLDWTGK